MMFHDSVNVMFGFDLRHKFIVVFCLQKPTLEPNARCSSRIGVHYTSPITITIMITGLVKLSITITVLLEKAITIIRLRLQLLVYNGNDSRLFIRHVHLLTADTEQIRFRFHFSDYSSIIVL